MTTPDGVHIGPVDLADDAVAARVIRLQRAAYRIEAGLIGFDRLPGLLEDVADIREHPIEWSGAYEGDELAGIIGWTVVGGTCDIDRLAVDPRFHRRGHGRRLVASVVSCNAGAASTVSTGADNAPAVALYESMGFRIVRHEQLPGVTIVHLRRDG